MAICGTGKCDSIYPISFVSDTAVVDDPLTQLSETQRTCLRLVAANRSSKEIAQSTGLSHQTVDQYISRAAAVLGAANRREAARIHGELENSAFNKPEFKADVVAAPENPATMDVQAGDGDPSDRRSLVAKWIPAIGGTRHDLRPVQVVQTILRVTLLTMGTAGAIIAIFYWLNRLML